jgi:lysophospholipase L1-like esterase
MSFSNQTLREVVHLSVGGTRTRAMLSNAFGTQPLEIGAAHLALRDSGSSIVAASGRRLMFDGKPSVTIPAGAAVYTDPVDLQIPALADVVVDIYIPGDTDTPSPLTMHNTAFQTNYISGPGNHAGATVFPQSVAVLSWFLLSRVEVMAPASVGTIVAFGDSITDGSRITPDTNNRWPNHLAKRLAGAAGGPRMAVVDAGIGGNRMLSEAGYTAGGDALARFDRDVLAQAGVTHVIVLDGINDIGGGRGNAAPSAEDIIAGYKQLIERAHVRGIKILGATLTPFEGANYFTDVGEAKRQALNRWIRTSKAYDGVIDFDVAARDPEHPTRYLPKYDAGDHLHPNDAGHEAMAKAIDLTLFASGAVSRTGKGR